MAAKKRQSDSKKTEVKTIESKEKEVVKAVENGMIVPQIKDPSEEVKFTLRISHKLMTRIDNVVKKKPAYVSRNTLICELLDRYIDRL